MRALLIAENQEERDFLSFALRREGLQVTTIAKAQDALPLPTETGPDLMVICMADSSIHDNSLHGFIEEVRSTRSLPIMLIATWLSEDEHCCFLDEGVDTVLHRPTSLRLFIRYTKQLLRRAGSSPNTLLTTIAADKITLSPANRTVQVADAVAVRLTQLEFRLLYVLMTNAGQVIETQEIIERVWGYNGEGSSDLVRGLVRRLRRKVETDTKQPRFIHNITGVGYRFSVDD